MEIQRAEPRDRESLLGENFSEGRYEEEIGGEVAQRLQPLAAAHPFRLEDGKPQLLRRPLHRRGPQSPAPAGGTVRPREHARDGVRPRRQQAESG